MWLIREDQSPQKNKQTFFLESWKFRYVLEKSMHERTKKINLILICTICCDIKATSTVWIIHFYLSSQIKSPWNFIYNKQNNWNYKFFFLMLQYIEHTNDTWSYGSPGCSRGTRNLDVGAGRGVGFAPGHGAKRTRLFHLSLRALGLAVVLDNSVHFFFFFWHWVFKSLNLVRYLVWWRKIFFRHRFAIYGIVFTIWFLKNLFFFFASSLDQRLRDD